MGEQLPFFSQVRVRRAARFPDYDGKLGVVVGVSEENGVIYGYSVSFLYSGEESLYLKPDELEPTGETVDRSLIYDGSTMKVRVHRDEGLVVSMHTKDGI